MRKSYKDYFFVGIQGLLFIIFFIPIIEGNLPNLKIFKMLGWVFFILGSMISLVSMLQLSTSLSPFPTPRHSGTLVTSGLYRWVRNPIYSGILCLFLGLGLMNFSIHQFFISLLLYFLFYFKVRYEESQLIKKYGKDYQTYVEVTGRFFPKFMKKS